MAHHVDVGRGRPVRRRQRVFGAGARAHFDKTDGPAHLEGPLTQNRLPLQSATARPLARLLKVAEPAPSGFLIVGANEPARAIAKALQQLGCRVLLTDSSWENIRAARMDGLTTYFGNPASQHADAHLDLVGLGHLLGLSPAGEINALACARFRHDFGHSRLFVLASGLEKQRSDKHRAAEEPGNAEGDNGSAGGEHEAGFE